MQHAVLKSLAAAGPRPGCRGLLKLGHPVRLRQRASGKTLVIESTSVTAPEPEFQPYVQERYRVLGPGDRPDLRALYIFNVMNPPRRRFGAGLGAAHLSTGARR
jgi:hypothetical protein